MKFGLSDDQLRQIQAILSKYPAITEAVVFGSRAMGNYKEASDVDVALKGDITLSMVAEVKYELEEDTYLPFFFDVIAYGLIDAPKLKEHIDKYGEGLYRVGWKEFRLGDVTSKIGSGATPTGGGNSYKTSGITFIRSQNVEDFRFSVEGLAFIDNEQAGALKNVSVEKNDILMNITGESVARCCIAPEEYLPARVNQHVAIIRPISEAAGYKYVFYYLHSIKPKLNSIAEIGCTRRALTKEMLENLVIPLPSIPEQCAISAVLSSLDAKIDLLNRQNKTLEGMASALWRKTFIENPRNNWEIKGLDRIADFLNGLPCQKYPPKTTVPSLPVIKIKELRVGITEDSDMATSDVPGKYIIKEGDVVFSWSGSLDVIIWGGRWGVLNQHLFKVTSIEYPKWFYYFWIKHHLPEFQDIAQDKATTMGHIQRHHLSDAKVQIPDLKTFGELDRQLSPLFEKNIFNLKVVRSLVLLRNTLLPKLMSGEVKVSV